MAGYNQELTPHLVKVIVILEELQVPYLIESFKFDDVKKAPFININPNGRVPGPLPHAFFSSSHVHQHL